jgi:hypothetical protein
MTAAPAAPPPMRLSWRTAVKAAVLVTLARPATWVVALAGFLAGGGAILLAWPILVLPTLSGIQNLLGAPVSTLAFGNPSSELIRMIVTLSVTATVLFAAGLLVGAWAEKRGVELVAEGGAEVGYTAPAAPRGDARAVLSVALIRLLGLLPPLVVGILVWSSFYTVTYNELTLPETLATPLPVRIIGQLPFQVALLIAAWVVGDAAASVGVRRLVLERRGVLAAWGLGWSDLLRRPHRILPVAVLGDVVVVIAAGPALVAAAIGWTRVRETLELAANSPVGVIVVAAWVAIWLGALALAGVGAAVRSALFTMESARRR